MIKDNSPWFAVLKGLCVAVFLNAIGMQGFEPEWWAATITLNIAVNV